MSSPEDIVQEQIAYYRARAGEYDEWFLRQGRYDRGADLNREWFAEVAEVERALARFNAVGSVLELACGTGLWTRHLARSADHITAVDASPEVLESNRSRLASLVSENGHPAPVEYVEADLFAWKPARRYDVVFFSFWLSHVPPEKFQEFWEMVRGGLKPGGRVFLVDSAYDIHSTAVDHRLEEAGATTARRRLNDGSEYQIVKVFYKPEQLTRRLRDEGWNADICQTARYFIYGECTPAIARAARLPYHPGGQ